MSIEILQFQDTDTGTEQSERETLIDDRLFLHNELGRLATKRTAIQETHLRALTMLLAPDSRGYEEVPISRDYIKKVLGRVTKELCDVNEEEIRTMQAMSELNQRVRTSGMDDRLLISYIQSAETTGIQTEDYGLSPVQPTSRTQSLVSHE